MIRMYTRVQRGYQERVYARTSVLGFVALLICVLLCVLAVPSYAQAPGGTATATAITPDIVPWTVSTTAFVDEMVTRHGFDGAELSALISSARYQSSIIRAMDTPGTALPWRVFRQQHITTKRIRTGVQFWQRHRALLERAALQYRVPVEIIVSTLGIESDFGQRVGRYMTFDALVTLAFAYPRRAAFFQDELMHYLLLMRDNRWPLRGVQGSFAGAIGMPQFMPSSYRQYAVDFDGDGQRDLRQLSDAIGSIAHYYQQHGWQLEAPVVVPASAEAMVAEPFLKAGILPHTAIAQYKQIGVMPSVPIDDEQLAALVGVEAAEGLQYYLILKNFYVITRYNRSVNYALAVYEFATQLRQQFSLGSVQSVSDSDTQRKAKRHYKSRNHSELKRKPNATQKAQSRGH